MNKKILISFLLLTPSIAWASGNEILSLLWLNFLVFLIVVTSLFLAKFTARQKLVVFTVYLVTNVVTLIGTSVIPYLENMYLINTVATAIPLVAWLAIYAYYYKKQL